MGHSGPGTKTQTTTKDRHFLIMKRGAPWYRFQACEKFGASKEAQTHKQATQAQSQAFAQKLNTGEKDGEKDHPT